LDQFDERRRSFWFAGNMVNFCPKNISCDRLPDLTYLERLHTRNEFLISSHHPLKETLIQQTGSSEKARVIFVTSQ
jgi:hypothetical protein